MQLTPRNLVLACGAMLAGGAVFGVVTTLAPAVSLPTATAANPTPAPTTWPTPASGDLGDEEITFPASPNTSATVAPSAWPTPVASSPASGPAIPSPSATPAAAPESAGSPSASLSTADGPDHAMPSATPATSTSARPRATMRPGSSQAARGARVPRPTATPTPARRTAPAPSLRRTSATGGWQAPSLRIGANTIAVPRLTSRATVRVTVGCSPSSACQISGDQLVIDPSATAVTVTWWAPAARGYRAWQVSRAL